MFKNGVTLKKDGWVTKFLNFVWEVDTVKKFQNFCPLFWVLVGTIVFIIPLLIVKLFSLFLDLNNKKWIDMNFAMKAGRITLQGVKIIFTYMVTFLVSLLLYFLVVSTQIFLLENGTYFGMFLLGLISFSVLVVGSLLHYAIKTGEELNEHSYLELPTYKKIIYGLSMFVWLIIKTTFYVLAFPFKLIFAFIYSIYKKACPRINWK